MSKSFPKMDEVMKEMEDEWNANKILKKLRDKKSMNGQIMWIEISDKGLTATEIENKFLEYKQNTMSNILTFFRDATATKDERLLKKLELENPIGTPTELGKELLTEILYKENRDKIIEIAKQMDEAKEDNK